MQTVKSTLRIHYLKHRPFYTRILHPTAPLPLGLWVLNVVVQRFFGVNGSVPWMVHYTSRVTVPEKIRIGERVWVSFAASGGCYVQGRNGIEIGDHSLFAPGVKIISANHDPDHLGQWLPAEPVVIGRRCWIGANAVILPGVQLGDGCRVGAGAVVTKSFPSDSAVGGVPARRITEGEAQW